MSARFTRTREDFRCGRCDTMVHGDGYTNHCPACLWSRHVDIHPGDRAAGCGALMEPVATLYESGRWVVVARCTGCGLVRRNRAASADRRQALLALTGKPAPPPGPAAR